MKKSIFLFLSVFTLISCGSKEPIPIKLNTDSCDFCKMTISNSKFAGELITDKGRIYKFDDVSCMIQYAKANSNLTNVKMFANDYFSENKFIPVEKGFYVKGGTISAPMHGNFVVFSTNEQANEYQSKLNAELTTWNEIYTSY